MRISVRWALVLLAALPMGPLAAARAAQPGVALKKHDHVGGVAHLAFSPSGEYLLSAGGYGDDRLCVWNFGTREIVQSLETRGCVGAAFLEETEFVWLDGGLRTDLVRSDRTNGSEIARVALEFRPSGFAVLAEGKLLAMGEQRRPMKSAPEGGLKIRLFQNAVERWAARQDSPSIGALAFSPDGKRLLVAGASAFFNEGVHPPGAPQLLEVTTGEGIPCEFEGVPAHRVDGPIAYAHDGTLVAAPWKHGIAVWDATTGKRAQHLERPRGLVRVSALIFSKGGDHLFVGGDAKEVAIYDLRKGELVRKVRVDPKACRALALSPDGAVLATGGTKNLELHRVEALTSAR